MRLTCEAECCDRRLPAMGRASKRGSWARTSMSIGRWPSSSSAQDMSSRSQGDIHVLLCSAQNRSGIKYKVTGNVNQVFAKFVSEGRATISFRNPPHDVFIRKADPLQLRSFLKILQSDSSPNASGGASQTTAMTPTTLGLLRPATAIQIRPHKTKLVITDGTSRQTSSSEIYPSTLTVLRVNNSFLKTIDSRMLKLKRLRELDVSSNELQDLPDQLATLLPCLEQLDVSSNRIACLSSSALSPTLVTMNVSGNLLRSLPDQICRLSRLRTLRLSGNLLEALPDQMHRLQQLRRLDVSNNRLQHLPMGVMRLRLDSIDVSFNPFQSIATAKSSSLPSSSSPTLLSDVPDLLELAARVVIRHGLPVSNEDVPRNLLAYLSRDHICPCGRRFVRSPMAAAVIEEFDLRRIASTVTDSGVCYLPVALRLCSPTCATSRIAFL